MFQSPFWVEGQFAGWESWRAEEWENEKTRKMKIKSWRSEQHTNFVIYLQQSTMHFSASNTPVRIGPRISKQSISFLLEFSWLRIVDVASALLLYMWGATWTSVRNGQPLVPTTTRSTQVLGPHKIYYNCRVQWQDYVLGRTIKREWWRGRGQVPDATTWKPAWESLFDFCFHFSCCFGTW